jgi:hypothetical protein
MGGGKDCDFTHWGDLIKKLKAYFHVENACGGLSRPKAFRFYSVPPTGFLSALGGFSKRQSLSQGEICCGNVGGIG